MFPAAQASCLINTRLCRTVKTFNLLEELITDDSFILNPSLSAAALGLYFGKYSQELLKGARMMYVHDA